MRSFFAPIIIISLLITLWEVIVRVQHVASWLFPSPSLIATTLLEKRDLFFLHTTQTLLEAFFGLGIAVVLGVSLAILMEWSQFFRSILKPFVTFSQTIPFIALAPLLVVWFGYGLLPKMIVIALACFFPIALNLYDGFQSVERGSLRLMQSLNASKWQIFSIVKLPASLPYFFSGLRISGTYLIGVALVSEWIGAERGLGILLIRSAKSYLTESVFAVIFIVTALSILIVFVIDRLTKVAIPWYYHQKEIR